MTVSKVALTFRKATPADVPGVQTLVQSAYRGDSSRAGWTTEADLVGGERIDSDGILAKMNEPNGVILIGHDSAATLTACCELIKRDGELAYFGLFAVDPNRQAGGFGRAVLEEAERYARDVLGVKKIEMQVIWTREELISWYIRRGYKKTKDTRPFPHLPNGAPLRDDLYFSVLIKDL